MQNYRLVNIHGICAKAKRKIYFFTYFPRISCGNSVKMREEGFERIFRP